ncbi:S26 family signal peptidase [Erythrobacter litoralis]|uniref:Putative F pilus assembly protein traF n=1 Tax=Erythrobacter litoralis (strain HTCC2594) TaxID=314225 RepID=Q2N5I7_ERYLH|nr:S26 family signal peptidase [Erythrobacter litoralis]ABC65054.1 putative F pilus assembly protein traF [Erythrobacter litoralis HTCC2594]
MTGLIQPLIQTLKRPLVLTALVLLPLGWSAVDAFAKEHAFLINASPSLPNWAFWLDKHAPIERGSLIFFEPPKSKLIEAHFGEGAQLFGKRVLGVPGDVVSHRGQEVFINGQRIAARLEETRLGIPLGKGPEGPIPQDCFYTGTDHPRGFDSRYAEIGFICRGQILGSGRAIL